MITKTTRNCLFAAAFSVLPSLTMALEMPRQGMTMDEVRSAYGSPARDLGSVGKPAITRWVYDGYTVYFEGRKVVHTVRTQPLSRPAPAAAPAMAAPVAEPAAEPAYAPAPVEEHVAPAPEFAPAAAPELAPEAPVAAEPQYTPPAEPVLEAEPAPTDTLPVSGGGGFRFDPVTGRLIIDEPAPASELAPAAAEQSAPAMESAPAAEVPAGSEMPATEPEPMSAAEPMPSEADGVPVAAPEAPATSTDPAPTGNALDGSLEFDPETGTFRPKQ